GNNNLIIYDIYNTGCSNITATNNIGAYLQSSGTENGYWNPGSCTNVTVDGSNQWGYQSSAVRASLTPFATKFPPPMIPPVPYSFPVLSPFTNHTASPCTAPVMPTFSLVPPAPPSTTPGLAQPPATASADVTTVKFFIDGTQTMLGQATSNPWSIAVN